MTKTFHAIYNGKVFKPEKPLDLKQNIRVRMTIEAPEAIVQEKLSFIKTAQSLKLEGPSDWSVHLEDYLYGKKSIANE